MRGRRRWCWSYVPREALKEARRSASEQGNRLRHRSSKNIIQLCAVQQIKGRNIFFSSSRILLSVFSLDVDRGRVESVLSRFDFLLHSVDRDSAANRKGRDAAYRSIQVAELPFHRPPGRAQIRNFCRALFGERDAIASLLSERSVRTGDRARCPRDVSGAPAARKVQKSMRCQQILAELPVSQAATGRGSCRRSTESRVAFAVRSERKKLLPPSARSSIACSSKNRVPNFVEEDTPASGVRREIRPTVVLR